MSRGDRHLRTLERRILDGDQQAVVPYLVGLNRAQRLHPEDIGLMALMSPRREEFAETLRSIGVPGSHRSERKVRVMQRAGWLPSVRLTHFGYERVARKAWASHVRPELIRSRQIWHTLNAAREFGAMSEVTAERVAWIENDQTTFAHVDWEGATNVASALRTDRIYYHMSQAVLFYRSDECWPPHADTAFEAWLQVARAYEWDSAHRTIRNTIALDVLRFILSNHVEGFGPYDQEAPPL